MSNEPEKIEGIYMDESQGMDEEERELFLDVRRSRSNDSFLGKFMPNQQPADRRLILDFNEPANNNITAGFKIFKKNKKEKRKNPSDYRKNICGYITKKIIREFVSPNYMNNVLARCQLHQVPYNIVKSYYLAKIEQVTGPSHIPKLLVPQNEEQIKIKLVFSEFFQWFLKERYLRYLLIEGKMSDKKAYIEYKNNILLSILYENKDLGFIKLEDEGSDESDDESGMDEEEEGSKGGVPN